MGRFRHRRTACRCGDWAGDACEDEGLGDAAEHIPGRDLSRLGRDADGAVAGRFNEGPGARVEHDVAASDEFVQEGFAAADAGVAELCVAGIVYVEGFWGWGSELELPPSGMVVCHEAADESVAEGFGCAGDGVLGAVFLGGFEFLLETGRGVSVV